MDSVPTIAGVVLTLNEEQYLARALRSLAWCDELFVVDSGSTDRTEQVAARCGARFLEHVQKPPFRIAEQRNWVLEYSGITSDWVLFLDADEEVGPALISSIHSCIRSSAALDAYELTPRYLFMGKWLKRTQGYPNWHPRLVKRGFARFEGGVWESFTANSLVGRIREPYDHYAFSKGLDDWLERHKRYADWDAREILSIVEPTGVSSVNITRKFKIRFLAAKLWPLRPILRFTQKYFFQAGFLEGWQSLLFCLMMFFYDLMAVIKVIQHFRVKAGKPL